MHTTPLSIVIAEVLKHTPAYVWAILAALIGFGTFQLRDQLIGRARVLLLPVALAGYSLWGAASAFGVQWHVFVAWGARHGFMAVGGALGTVAAQSGIFCRSATFSPSVAALCRLVAMLGVFARALRGHGHAILIHIGAGLAAVSIIVGSATVLLPAKTPNIATSGTTLPLTAKTLRSGKNSTLRGHCTQRAAPQHEARAERPGDEYVPLHPERRCGAPKRVAASANRQQQHARAPDQLVAQLDVPNRSTPQESPRHRRACVSGLQR